MACMKSIFGTAGFVIAIALIYSAADAHNAQDAGTVTISQADCATLVGHAPVADVAFKPGVDLAGRPVAPADPNAAPPLVLPERFSIPITVDLRKRLGIPADPSQYQTEHFTIGTVVWRDGAAWFNGQPLQSQASRDLAALCQQRLIRR
ncbi:MAG: hypothetical protein V3S44_08810 [Alphaproteobacteria bacterium]